MKSYTIWFTGLPKSGKTTIANELVKELNKRNIPNVLLDDTKVRKILSSDLRENKYEYYRHVIRLANVSYIINTSEILSIVCTFSPKKVLRRYGKALIKNFIEIYICCPQEVCEERAKEKFNEFSSYYEEPDSSILKLDTCKDSIETNVKKLIEYLENKKIIGEKI